MLHLLGRLTRFYALLRLCKSTVRVDVTAWLARGGRWIPRRRGMRLSGARAEAVAGFRGGGDCGSVGLARRRSPGLRSGGNCGLAWLARGGCRIPWRRGLRLGVARAGGLSDSVAAGIAAWRGSRGGGRASAAAGNAARRGSRGGRRIPQRGLAAQWGSRRDGRLIPRRRGLRVGGGSRAVVAGLRSGGGLRLSGARAAVAEFRDEACGSAWDWLRGRS